MELSIPITSKDKGKDKPLDGSGIALVATTPDLTIRIGTDQEIAHNLLDHVFPFKMIMLWICPLLSAKPQMTKNTKSTERQADALNVENKATLSATVLIKRHMLVQSALSKLKMTTDQLFPTLLQLHLSLRE